MPAALNTNSTDNPVISAYTRNDEPILPLQSCHERWKRTQRGMQAICRTPLGGRDEHCHNGYSEIKQSHSHSARGLCCYSKNTVHDLKCLLLLCTSNVTRLPCETTITPVTCNEVVLSAPWQINSLAIYLHEKDFNIILIDSDTIKDFVLPGSQVCSVVILWCNPLSINFPPTVTSDGNGS